MRTARACSTLSRIRRARAGWVPTTAKTDGAGTSSSALDQTCWATLMTSSSTGMRSSAESCVRDGAAEGLVGALDALLLVLRELARAREVDLAHAARRRGARLLAAWHLPAVAAASDQRLDLILGQNFAHVRPSRASSCSSMPPASLQVTRAGLDVDADGAAARAGRWRRRETGDAVRLRARRGRRARCAGRSRASRRGEREHVGAADDHGDEVAGAARPAGQRARRAPGPRRRRTCRSVLAAARSRAASRARGRRAGRVCDRRAPGRCTSRGRSTTSTWPGSVDAP